MTIVDTQIKFRAGYKYQLAEDYTSYVAIYPEADIKTEFIDLATDGLLRVRAGYAWDGPSGPTYDTKTFMRGSAAHDAGYQLLRMGLLPQSLRLDWDAVLIQLCKEDGMMAFRRWYVQRELRKFGGAAASPDNVKEVFTAP